MSLNCLIRKVSSGEATTCTTWASSNFSIGRRLVARVNVE